MNEKTTQVIQMLEAGASNLEITKSLGVHPPAISNIKKRYGLKMRKKYTDDDMALVVELFKNNQGAPAIAKMTSIPLTVVRNFLKKTGTHTPKIKNPDRDTTILGMLESGQTAPKIAKTLGITNAQTYGTKTLHNVPNVSRRFEPTPEQTEWLTAHLAAGKPNHKQIAQHLGICLSTAYALVKRWR